MTLDYFLDIIDRTERTFDRPVSGVSMPPTVAASERGLPVVDGTYSVIRQASLELFSSLGFNATGMRLIANEARISVATLYHYISSKEDLLYELLRDNLDNLYIKASNSLSAAQNDVVQSLTNLVNVHVTVHATDRDLCQVSDRELRSLKEPAQLAVIEMRDSYEALWRSILARGRDEGVFTFEDLTITAHALLEMCTGVVHWFRPDGRLSVEEVVKLHQNLALSMVGSTGQRNEN